MRYKTAGKAAEGETSEELILPHRPPFVRQKHRLTTSTTTTITTTCHTTTITTITPTATAATAAASIAVVTVLVTVFFLLGC